MRRLGGRTWVTRDEIAEIHEVRAIALLNKASQLIAAGSIDLLFGLEYEALAQARAAKANADTLRWVDAYDKGQGRAELARAMDNASPFRVNAQRSIFTFADPDYDWGLE